jgi:GT2 family glycosyltransferase
MKPNLYIVILNWNGNDDTIDCIRSIKMGNYDNYTILLVDNGSAKKNLDELKTWLQVEYKMIVQYVKEEAILGSDENKERDFESYSSAEKIILIENNENLGFAAGNNVALKYLMHKDNPTVLLLNNDTVLLKNTLAELMTFLSENEEFVAVTPQIRYFNPDNIIWNCGGEITWFGNRRYFHARKDISGVPQAGFREVTFITGCALLFRPSVTGVLTEKYFFGEEDMEFSFRQKRNGNKMACCFSSVLYHKVSSSLNSQKINLVGHTYLHYISRFINIRDYSSRLSFPIKLIVNLLYAIPMVTIRYNFTFRQTFFLVSTILFELKRINTINKDYCLNCLREDFNSKASWIK